MYVASRTDKQINDLAVAKMENVQTLYCLARSSFYSDFLLLV